MMDQAVIFDLDGTLLDTLDDLAESMNAVLSRFGFPEHEREEYKFFVGDGMDKLVERALPPEGRRQPLLGQCLLAMQEEYASRWKLKTRPYPGIPELLDTLSERHVPLNILSNKPQEATWEVVKALLPRWDFRLILGARPRVPKKPDPTGAKEIAQRLGLPPERFFYLGDTGIDMLTAVNAGMYPVGVLWGFRSAQELRENGARVLLKHPMDFLGVL